MSETNDWVISSANRNVYSGFGDFIKARPVLAALVRRELKSRYRGSILGFSWVLGKPIMTLIVFTLVVGEILGASRSIDYFALYLFIGLMFWGFFSEAVSVGTQSIVSAEGLVQKISFPREILPVSAVITAFINMLIQVPVLIVGYVLFRRFPQISNFGILILALGILFSLTLAITLILSAVNVYVRDVKPLTDLVLMLLMYSVPIIYSWTFVKDAVLNSFSNTTLFEIYMHNPLTVIIVCIQDALWPGQRIYSSGQIASDYFSIGSPILWAWFAFSGFLLVMSYKLFLKLEPNFAREL